MLIALWKTLRRLAFRRMILVLAMCLALQSRATAANVQEFVGQWHAGAIDGAGPLKDNTQCTYMTWTDRSVKLDPVPGNPTRVVGEWVRKGQSMWMTTKSGTCRWPGESKFNPGYFGVVDWTVSGILSADGLSLKITGKYETCGGNACASVGQLKGFETELRIVNGMLVDTNLTPQTDDDIFFARQDREAQTKDTVMMVLRPLLAKVDDGKADDFYEETNPKFQAATSRVAWRQSVQTMREQLGPVLSRSLIAFVPADHCPQISKDRGEYALIINGYNISNNRAGLEYVVLSKEEGKWKIALYWVGS